MNTKITIYRGHLSNGMGPWWGYRIRCGKQAIESLDSWKTKAEAVEAAQSLVCSIFAHITHLMSKLRLEEVTNKPMKKKKKGGC